MNIISVIPNDFGAVITAKGDGDSHSTSYHWSHHYQNIYDPHKEGYWLGNGWDTLTEAIEYIIGLSNDQFEKGYNEALMDVTMSANPSLTKDSAIAYAKTWANILKG